jgi:hypothetical protein
MTSSERITFHFNGEDVTYLPLKYSHTKHDVAVYFHGSDVLRSAMSSQRTTPL